MYDVIIWCLASCMHICIVHDRNKHVMNTVNIITDHLPAILDHKPTIPNYRALQYHNVM